MSYEQAQLVTTENVTVLRSLANVGAMGEVTYDDLIIPGCKFWPCANGYMILVRDDTYALFVDGGGTFGGNWDAARRRMTSDDVSEMDDTVQFHGWRTLT